MSLPSRLFPYQLTTFFLTFRHTQIIALYVVVLLDVLDINVPEDKPIPKLSFERATLAQRDGPCALDYTRR
jgi:hypothetical protein